MGTGIEEIGCRADPRAASKREANLCNGLQASRRARREHQQAKQRRIAEQTRSVSLPRGLFDCMTGGLVPVYGLQI